ncbi:UbiA prenyltransferase family protein [Actinoalloteichus caeruleus]|uniref:UbiA prenyltransferase family protein n=1 Tax=Actinoalloteichus cyanogriseus TaxID=2893586 RepID=UPI0006905873|nr:UbiA prenyltransferase family protein [Actinoalloteichus caeruleus]
MDHALETNQTPTLPAPRPGDVDPPSIPPPTGDASARGSAPLAPARSGRAGPRDLFRLVRPKQWVKNVVVVLPPLLTAPAAVLPGLWPLLATVLAFVAASSTVYVLNDLRDREADRLHPVKRNRPLASGRVSTATAWFLIAAGCAAMVLWSLVLPWAVSLVIGGYLALNLAYCLVLKNRPLVDVSVVATGFVLRAVAGSLAVGAAIDPWLMICVYCACLLLAVGKRRHELTLVERDPAALAHRPTLASYSVTFLDHVIVVTLAAALLSYANFVGFGPTAAASALVVLTFPLAAFAVFRYLQLVTVRRTGGDPGSDLFRDVPTVVNAGLWLAVLVVAGAL